MAEAVVIGAGPAGLMAAEELARAGHSVLIADAKPSFGRKLLMAGKSGLNLTRDEPLETFLSAYDEAADWLRPMITEFDSQRVMEWAQGLDQDLFTGSTGRIFPKVMKASPLLRNWLARLDRLGVERRTHWRWVGWRGEQLLFETPQGAQAVSADATILALGGASWARLSSDGAWAEILEEHEIALAPFAPANAGLSITWSSHMSAVFGQPLKGVTWRAGKTLSRGEAVVSHHGLEGGGIYSVCKPVRDGAALTVDLHAGMPLETATQRLSKPRGKASMTNHLRKRLGLDAVKLALLMEFGRPLPEEPADLARLIKTLPIRHDGLRPMDQAISTAGGVGRTALDGDLMLRAMPGAYCVGEMLDWEAPTGGYLLTACFATGRWAGRAAARRLEKRS